MGEEVDPTEKMENWRGILESSQNNDFLEATGGTYQEWEFS